MAYILVERKSGKVLQWPAFADAGRKMPTALEVLPASALELLHRSNHAFRVFHTEPVPPELLKPPALM